jgi:hypothetical protein
VTAHEVLGFTPQATFCRRSAARKKNGSKIFKCNLHIMIQSLAPHWAGTYVAVGQAFQPDSAGRQAGKPDLLRNRLTENSVGALTNWVIQGIY